MKPIKITTSTIIDVDYGEEDLADRPLRRFEIT